MRECCNLRSPVLDVDGFGYLTSSDGYGNISLLSGMFNRDGYGNISILSEMFNWDEDGSFSLYKHSLLSECAQDGYGDISILSEMLYL
jgi:hypothetical protein